MCRIIGEPGPESLIRLLLQIDREDRFAVISSVSATTCLIETITEPMRRKGEPYRLKEIPTTSVIPSLLIREGVRCGIRDLRTASRWLTRIYQGKAGATTSGEEPKTVHQMDFSERFALYLIAARETGRVMLHVSPTQRAALAQMWRRTPDPLYTKFTSLAALCSGATAAGDTKSLAIRWAQATQLPIAHQGKLVRFWLRAAIATEAPGHTMTCTPIPDCRCKWCPKACTLLSLFATHLCAGQPMEETITSALHTMTSTAERRHLMATACHWHSRTITLRNQARQAR